MGNDDATDAEAASFANQSFTFRSGKMPSSQHHVVGPDDFQDWICLWHEAAVLGKNVYTAWQSLVRPVSLGGIGRHPDDASADVGGSFHGQRVEAADFCIQGHSADELNPAHNLADGIRDGGRGILVALENEAAHPEVFAALGNFQSIAAALNFRVRLEVDMDVNCAFQEPVNVAPGIFSAGRKFRRLLHPTKGVSRNSRWGTRPAHYPHGGHVSPQWSPPGGGGVGPTHSSRPTQVRRAGKSCRHRMVGERRVESRQTATADGYSSEMARSRIGWKQHLRNEYCVQLQILSEIVTRT